VTASIGTGSGTLLGTATATASAGIATFGSLSITKADVYTLHLIDGSLTAANTGSFTISPASAARSHHDAAGNTVAGVTMGNIVVKGGRPVQQHCDHRRPRT